MIHRHVYVLMYTVTSPGFPCREPRKGPKEMSFAAPLPHLNLAPGADLSSLPALQGAGRGLPRTRKPAGILPSRDFEVQQVFRTQNSLPECTLK